jgi:RNA polymerase sigma-70 factor (ECF subfamily)
MTDDEAAWLDRRLYSAAREEQQRSERSRDAASLLARILPRLAPKDQAVLHLLYGEERDVAEVAGLLGWTKSNVKVRAFRARRAMRKALQQLLHSKKENGHEA